MSEDLLFTAPVQSAWIFEALGEFIGINHAQKRSSMPLSMHGERFAALQPDAGVYLTRGAA